jgi:transposase InsO family protein
MIAEALQVSRSNLSLQIQGSQKRKLSPRKGDEELLTHIKEVAHKRPTYGYRRITILLNEKLRKIGCSSVNRKRVYRLMKRNNLLQKPSLKPARSHTGKVETLYSNTRWCSDTFCIQCLNGEQVHVVFSIDSCDREVMRYIASTIGIDGQAIRDLMVETVEYRIGRCQTAYPIQWLTDNGSCYTAKETVLCGKRLGLDIRTTPAYSPESNGIAEAFVKTLKRDYVWLSDLKNAKTVMDQLPKWIEDYNERAPHKALKMCSPRAFIKKQKLAG